MPGFRRRSVSPEHAPDREGLPLARETFLLLRGPTVPVKARLAAAALIHGTSRPESLGSALLLAGAAYV